MSILQMIHGRQKPSVLQVLLFEQNLEIHYGLCLAFSVPDNWDLLLEWGIKNLKGRSFRVTLCKIAWWATVYHLWQQRNARLHAGEMKLEENIIKAIRRDFRAKMEAVKAPASILHQTLCSNWNILLYTIQFVFCFGLALIGQLCGVHLIGDLCFVFFGHWF